MARETFHPARSSFIAQLDYDDQEKDLTITFIDGKAFAYHGVTPATYRNMTLAGSLGGFFHRHIKDSYPFEEV